MSDFNPESYFQLDVDAPLFRALYSEKPSWWEVVKNDSRVYINIHCCPELLPDSNELVSKTRLYCSH